MTGEWSVYLILRRGQAPRYMIRQVIDAPTGSKLLKSGLTLSVAERYVVMRENRESKERQRRDDLT
jgi:hypothetical protein